MRSLSLKVMAVLFLLSVGMVISSQAAGPLPDTGQTKCYDNEKEIPCPQPGALFYGQDAQYYGLQHSYTKLDAGGNDLPDSATTWYQVRDNVTGLIWEVKQNWDGTKDYGNPHDADNTYTWYDSNPATNGSDVGTPGDGTDTEDFINALNAGSGYCNHTDWRLPTVKELSLLADLGKSRILAFEREYFPQCLSSEYWSSTACADNASSAWLVNFYDGRVYSFRKEKRYSLRAVRSGQSQSLQALIFNENDPTTAEDDTVIDPNTGLMWQRFVVQGPMSWLQALAYCENLTLTGYDDWRLPDRHELQSLVDYNHFNPCLDENVFPEIYWTLHFSPYYWSSTTFIRFTDDAWRVNFITGEPYAMFRIDFGYGGLDGVSYKTDDNCNVRAVRSLRPLDSNYDISSANHNAVPSHTLPAIEPPATVTPSDNEVQVGACDNIMVQPRLLVPSADVGKTATLIMYIYLPDDDLGAFIPSKEKVLTFETKFDLLPCAIDFSDLDGLNFYIYYGYVIGSTIKYNAYAIVVDATCGYER